MNKDEERIVLSRRFGVIESYLRVFDNEYYHEESSHALERVIKELYFVARNLGADPSPYNPINYDLSYNKIFGVRDELEKEYKKLLEIFING